MNFIIAFLEWKSLMNDEVKNAIGGSSNQRLDSYIMIDIFNVSGGEVA